MKMQPFTTTFSGYAVYVDETGLAQWCGETFRIEDARGELKNAIDTANPNIRPEEAAGA